MKPKLPLLSLLVVGIIINMNFSDIIGNFRNAIGGLFNRGKQQQPLLSPQPQQDPDQAFRDKGLIKLTDKATGEETWMTPETARSKYPHGWSDNSPSPSPAARGSVLGNTEKKPVLPKVMGTYGRSSKARALKPDTTVIDAISKAADQYKVPADLLFDIAAQESMFNPTARAAENGFPDSSATGLFQFTNGTWDTVNNYGKQPGSTLRLPSNDRLDPYANAAAAAYLIANGQLGRWNASQNVWGGGYDLNDLLDFYAQTAENDIPQAGWR